MSRLFVRIWLTFWAVLAATFLTALAVDYGLAIQRAHDIDRLSPNALAAQGAQVIATRGEWMGRHWILTKHNLAPELEEYVVTPDGRELAGRSLSEVQQALRQPRGRSPFPAEVTKTVNGRPYRFVFVRVRSLAFDLWDILLQPWVLGGLVLAISGLGAALLARSLTRPIRRLQARVRAIAAGDLSGRTGPELSRRGDELGQLARDVDRMAQSLQALIAAREAMLRDVSHELRAPLARLRAVADLARRRTPGVDATLDRIDREVDRLDGMIDQILRFSRLQADTSLTLERMDLAGLAAEVVEDARIEAASGERKVLLEPAPPLIVHANPALVRSALDNILRNAVRFSPKDGCVKVRLSAENGAAQVHVLDEGPGVDPSDLPRIFEPFHGEGSGAGLGLAITRRVASLHGGTVTAQNRQGGGLTVTLSLPLADAQTLEPQIARKSDLARSA